MFDIESTVELCLFTFSDTPQDVLQLPSDFTTWLVPECDTITMQTNVMLTSISLTGRAPVQCYRDILSNVTFVNYADEPGNTNRTITFELADDRGFLFSASTLVTIIPTNDPAIFSFNNSLVTFNEMARTPVNLFQLNDILIDSDGDSLWWLTVEIRPSIDEMDILSADPGTSNLVIESSTNLDKNTVLTISGYANFSVYETVLRTLTFYNSFPGINLTNRSIHVVTFDGETESPPTLIIVYIIAFDDVSACYFGNSMVSIACNKTQLYHVCPPLVYVIVLTISISEYDISLS